MSLPLILSLILFDVFLFLSLLHINWALGGKWGFEVVIPTNPKGQKVLNPKKRYSLTVGLCLLVFSLYYLLKSDLLSFYVSSKTPFVAGWIISILFILRAIGDFKYIGIFKTIKETDYANLDSKYFTPMCLLMGVLGIILELV